MNNDENTPWQYKPSGGTATAPPPVLAPAPAAPPAPPSAGGPVTWVASEYIDHDRGAGWYVLLILGVAILSTIVYFLTKDYFAIGTIVIVGVIVGFVAGKKPRQLNYELSASGIRIGDKLYSFGLFKSFSIVKDGALSSIQLTPIKRFMPPVSAYYAAGDEEKIVDTIGAYLPYEERGLDAIDRLSRRLRF